MPMRASRVLRKLRAGLPASCTKLNLMDARVAEIACLQGKARGVHQAPEVRDLAAGSAFHHHRLIEQNGHGTGAQQHTYRQRDDEGSGG